VSKNVQNTKHRITQSLDCGGQLSGSQLTGWGTTAATCVPRWWIGEHPRKRVAPDKEGVADQQCLGEARQTLILNRGRWCSLSLLRQIHLGDRNSNLKPDWMASHGRLQIALINSVPGQPSTLHVPG